MEKKELALSIVGSSRRNGEREKDDFYPTPTWAVQKLLEVEEFPGVIWEPACGDGAISKELILQGNDVISSDLIDRGYGIAGVDFLNPHWSVIGCNHIITNPPYKLALEFINHSKTRCNGKIAMFLKTTFLEGAKRYEMFNDKDFPLKTVYQFSKRVSIYKNGDKMKNSGMIAYAWFVWDKNHVGKPTIEWIL